MSYKSKTSGQYISDEYYDFLYNLLQNYRDVGVDFGLNDTHKQQVAIVTLLNDFTEVNKCLN